MSSTAIDPTGIPQYQCHKKVHALKINMVIGNGDGSANLHCGKFGIYASKQYMEKHKPQVGGYWVLYKGGYESYSPAKEFEEGYTLIDNHEGDAPEVPPFVQRIIDEQKELDEKIEKLHGFLASEKSLEIDPKQLSLLNVQIWTMGSYLQCLNERLKLLIPDWDNEEAD